MNSKKDTQEATKSPSASSKKSNGFTAEERAAMRPLHGEADRGLIALDDHVVERRGEAADELARRGVKLDYTRPGKPTDNGLIESFNGGLRDEFLNANEFVYVD